MITNNVKKKLQKPLATLPEIHDGVKMWSMV